MSDDLREQDPLSKGIITQATREIADLTARAETAEAALAKSRAALQEVVDLLDGCHLLSARQVAFDAITIPTPEETP